MNTECTQVQLEFQGVGRRKVQGAFDGGHISSDGGALLLRELDIRLKLSHRFSQCFTDHRNPKFIEHSLEQLLSQRLYGLALGYEDLNDHNDLRHDPLLALAIGKSAPEVHSLASSSTLNRLELTPADANKKSRYKKTVYHPEAYRGVNGGAFSGIIQKAPQRNRPGF